MESWFSRSKFYFGCTFGRGQLCRLLYWSLQSLLLLINVFWKQVWDYQTKSCVQTLEGHTHNVSVVCFHPELPIIITVSEDGTARLWHATTCM
ncbi:hypothetical protein YC2023_017702 [Brassica napus]